MNNELKDFELKCNICGGRKKVKTQNLELAKKITIEHKKCGGIFRYPDEETSTIEPEPLISEFAKKSISYDTYSSVAKDMSEINLVASKKIDAIFECDCRALIKISGDNIEKAQKLTFQHKGCIKPEKGTFIFLTIVGKAVASTGRYSNEKIKKMERFICNICPCNDQGKNYRNVDPCPKDFDLLNLCYQENIEYRYWRGSNLTTRSALQISDDVEDIIIVIGEDKRQVSLNDIKRLFINRYDRYSLQNPDAPEKFPDVKEPLTDPILLKSMLGSITIGTRAVDPQDNKIKWVCYDIDADHNENPRLVADTIIKYLKEWYNLTGILEKSGSPDSYHVWVILEKTDNEYAYQFDQSFKARIKTVLNSMGIETEERSIDRGVAKGEGYMIKLPFNKQLKNGVRSEFLADISKIQPEKLPSGF